MAFGKDTQKETIESFEVPKDPRQLVVWANKKLEDGTRLDEFQAKQNLAFMLGDQWGVWDGERKRFRNADSRRGDPNAPVRITINKIGGHVERIIARLTKNAPEPECRPVTDTQADVNAAKVGTRILDHELNARLDFQQRLIELYFWVLPLGWSFFHLRWDPNAGPIVGTVDNDGKPQQVHQGEIAMEEVPAFEVRIDPNARRFRDAKHMTRTVAMTKEAVYEQYGVVPEGEDAESLSQEWRVTESTQNTDGKGGKSGKSTAGKFVAVHQLWIRPGGRAIPEGLVLTWSGTTILEKPLPFPYEHGHLPFVPLNMLPAIGGNPAGRTWVTDLVGMQRDYNDARSREAQIRRTLTPKYIGPVGSIDPSRMTSRVETILYNPIGTAPTLQMPDGRWMAQFESAMNRVDSEMGDRAGQQDVSQGKAASSAPAAGILALQEADETKMAISSKELAASIKEIGFQVLMLVKQFWTEERVIRTWSRDGVLEADHFSGSDLGQQLDVHVSAESGLPRSKTARTQMAADLFTQGIITEPRDFVRMLDLPGTDFLVETLNKDAAQATREHGHLLRMEPVEAKAWHNHVAHIAEHDGFRKTEEYEQLDPEQQAWFDGHVTAHYQLVLGQVAMQNGGAQAEGGENPSGQNGMPVDPVTGAPSDPNSIGGVSGNLGSDAQAQQGSIGGAGNPGPVPGVTEDTQQYRMGN